jgi:putative endonuclease
MIALSNQRNKRQAAENRGRWGEWLAAAYLWCLGYRLRARRYKTPLGEIDLIATRGRTLVLIEVKTRDTLVAAIDAIAPGSYRRLRAAAELYRARHTQFSEYRVRFDLIAVEPPFRLRHLDNIDLNGA